MCKNFFNVNIYICLKNVVYKNINIVFESDFKK